MGGLLDKPVTDKETEDGAGKDGSWAFGVSSMQGWRKAMEDAHLAVSDFDPERNLGLFGVFDGHGGSSVAKVAARELPGVLRQLPSFKEGRYRDALYEAFLKLDAWIDSKEGRKMVQQLIDSEEPDDDMDDDDDDDGEFARAMEELEESDEDEDMEEEGKKAIDLAMQDGGKKKKKKANSGQDEEEEAEEDDEDDDEEEEEESEEELDGGREDSPANQAWANGDGPDGQGCTAVVALVRGGANPEVWCANAGDSRCVLMRGTTAKNMSRDHKPTMKSELTRIRKAGGFVTDEGRVDGNLNLSRSLGDFAYKKDTKLTPQEQKISAEAEVRHCELLGGDRFLLLGCDGIFEKAKSQDLVNFMAPLLTSSSSSSSSSKKLSDACSAFLDHNIAPNPRSGLGCDNMTLMVVDLKGGSWSKEPASVKSTNSTAKKTSNAVRATSAKPARAGPRPQSSRRWRLRCLVARKHWLKQRHNHHHHHDSASSCATCHPPRK